MRKSLSHTMIELAVDQSLKEIEKNNKSAITNLIELGSELSSQKMNHQIYELINEMKRDLNHPYYDLITKIVRSVDHQHLKNFGINLAYNNLTIGANIIKEVEKHKQYNIPWTMVFNLNSSSDTNLSVSEISDFLQVIEEGGIFSSIFVCKYNTQTLEKLIAMLAKHNNSAYVLFLEPNQITKNILMLIRQAMNICIAIEVNTASEIQSSKDIFDLIDKYKILYGSYSKYSQEVLGANFTKSLTNTNSFFHIIISEAPYPNDYQHFLKTISKKPTKLFIIDFYTSISFIDKLISPDDCFIAINEDGSVSISSLNNKTDLNIQTQTIGSILKNVKYMK